MSSKHPKPAQMKNGKLAEDDKLDEALEETFPASDPIALEPVDGPTPPRQAPSSKHKKP